MFRSLLAVLLAASALAATAQTAPRRTTKAATTAKTKPVPAATSDATSTAADGGFGNGAPGVFRGKPGAPAAKPEFGTVFDFG
jgi:hypothetical protein